MAPFGQYQDLTIDLTDYVAIIEIQRPPHNHFDLGLIEALADAALALDEADECRCLVLAAAGKSFCAGANLGSSGDLDTLDWGSAGAIYDQAVRLFRARKPMVGAIHGAAVGGGLGLALVPDFRVTCPQARFRANFSGLGVHPGFGLTVTLPELIGHSPAEMMLYTGRWVMGDEAARIGLADVLVPTDRVRSTAVELAREIAASAPLAVMSTRATLRRGLADRVEKATAIELSRQYELIRTDDFKEGVAALSGRRNPVFRGT